MLSLISDFSMGCLVNWTISNILMHIQLHIFWHPWFDFSIHWHRFHLRIIWTSLLLEVWMIRDQCSCDKLSLWRSNANSALQSSWQHAVAVCILFMVCRQQFLKRVTTNTTISQRCIAYVPFLFTEFLIITTMMMMTITTITASMATPPQQQEQHYHLQLVIEEIMWLLSHYS